MLRVALWLHFFFTTNKLGTYYDYYYIPTQNRHPFYPKASRLHCFKHMYKKNEENYDSDKKINVSIKNA